MSNVPDRRGLFTATDLKEEQRVLHTGENSAEAHLAKLDQTTDEEERSELIKKIFTAATERLQSLVDDMFDIPSKTNRPDRRSSDILMERVIESGASKNDSSKHEKYELSLGIRKGERFRRVKVEKKTWEDGDTNTSVFNLVHPFSITVDGKEIFSKNSNDNAANLEAAKRVITLTDELKAIEESTMADVRKKGASVLQRLKRYLKPLKRLS